MNSTSSGDRWLLRGVMLAVGVWGTILAIGAALFGVDPATREVHYAPNPLRGLIVLACVGGFLAIWGIALWRRKA